MFSRSSLPNETIKNGGIQTGSTYIQACVIDVFIVSSRLVGCRRLALRVASDRSYALLHIHVRQHRRDLLDPDQDAHLRLFQPSRVQGSRARGTSVPRRLYAIRRTLRTVVSDFVYRRVQIALRKSMHDLGEHNHVVHHGVIEYIYIYIYIYIIHIVLCDVITC